MENTNKTLPRLHLKKISFLSFGKNPAGDWKAICFFSATLAVCIVALSVYMFIKIDKGDIFVVEKPRENLNRTLDIEVLRDTIVYYENKAQEFERIKSSNPTLPDPSI